MTATSGKMILRIQWSMLQRLLCRYATARAAHVTNVLKWISESEPAAATPREPDRETDSDQEDAGKEMRSNARWARGLFPNEESRKCGDVNRAEAGKRCDDRRAVDTCRRVGADKRRDVLVVKIVVGIVGWIDPTRFFRRCFMVVAAMGIPRRSMLHQHVGGGKEEGTGDEQSEPAHVAGYSS